MLQISVGDQKTYAITNEEGQWFIDNAPADLDIRPLSNGLVSVLYKGRSFTAVIEKTDVKSKEVSISVNGQSYKATIKEPIDQLLSKMGMGMNASKKIESVKAPMPGMILKILVTPGQVLKKGDGMLILEAMKMENLIKASGNATVKAIKVDERVAVEKGTVLIELE